MDAQVDLTERSVFDKNPSIRVQIDSEPLIGWLCGPLGEMASLEYLRKRSKECAENDKRLVRKIGKLKNQPYMYYPNSTFTSTSTSTFLTSLSWNSGRNTGSIEQDAKYEIREPSHENVMAPVCYFSSQTWKM